MQADLSGKLSIQPVDNGWIVTWFSGTVEHREVFVEWGSLLCRIGEVCGPRFPAMGTVVPDHGRPA